MISDQTLYAGADGEWTDSLSDFLAGNYDLTVMLKCGTNSVVELAAIADGDDYIISYTADQLQAGDNDYQYKFIKKTDGKISIPYVGVVNVKALLSANTDTRSDDKKVLDALKEARIKIVGREYTEISINGKSTKFKTLEEIENAIVRYEKKLGLRITPRIVTAFV